MKPTKQTVPAVNPAWIKPHLETLSGVSSALYDQAEEMGGGYLAEQLESLARKLNAACVEIENKALAVNPTNESLDYMIVWKDQNGFHSENWGNSNLFPVYSDVSDAIEQAKEAARQTGLSYFVFQIRKVN